MTTFEDRPKYNPYASESTKRQYLPRIFGWADNLEKAVRKLFESVPQRASFPNDQFYINALESWIETAETKILGEEAS